MMLLDFYVDDIIKTALKEDINYIDSTTDLLISPKDESEAYFIAKADGVVAGLEIALRVFKLVDSNIKIFCHTEDGNKVKKGDIVLVKASHFMGFSRIVEALTKSVRG